MGCRTDKRWVPGVLIIVGVLCLFFVGDEQNSSANTQMKLQTGGDGLIVVVPVQIARDSYGLAMVDTAQQTLWIYELNSRGPAHKRLRLLAARSWRYDRKLEEFNTDEPTPRQVKMLLESLGGPLKMLNRKKQQGAGVKSILEMAEPNDKNFGR